MVRLMLVRSAHPSDADGCVDVLALLPEYFTASTHDEVRRGTSDHMALVADVDGTVVGFILIDRRHRRSAEVTFIAVHPAYRNQGIGSGSCSSRPRLLMPQRATNRTSRLGHSGKAEDSFRSTA